mgnify:CR=1 FL=1
MFDKKLNYEVIKFCIIGAFGVTFHYCIYIIALTYFNIHYLISGFIGYLSVTVPVFLLNRYWTFRSKIPINKGYAIYILINVITISTHAIVQFFSKEFLGVPEIYSSACGLVASTIVGFILVRKLMKSKI